MRFVLECLSIIASIYSCRYLHWSLDEDKISSQNTATVIAAVAGNPGGAHAALTFVIENWDILIQR